MADLTFRSDGFGDIVDCNFPEAITCSAIKVLVCKSFSFCPSLFYFTRNGRHLDSDTIIDGPTSLRLRTKILGGKGGFGSMLRALGAQIEKTTNHEAMRDLSGRRVRDVNNEKALTQWLSSAGDRERHREERRRERIERKKESVSDKVFKFADSEYSEVKSKVLENLEGAVEAGLKKTTASTSQVVKGCKRKSEEDSEGPSSKIFGMAAVDGDFEDFSSSSDEDDEINVPTDLSEMDPSPFKAETKHESPNSNSQTDVEDQTVNINSKPDSDAFVEAKEEQSQQENFRVDHSILESIPEEKKEESKEESPKLVETPTFPLDLEKYETVESLLVLGLENLKLALMALGLKCGGTAEERAVRLWSIRGKDKQEWDKTLFAKGKVKAKNA